MQRVLVCILFIMMMSVSFLCFAQESESKDDSRIESLNVSQNGGEDEEVWTVDSSGSGFDYRVGLTLQSNFLEIMLLSGKTDLMKAMHKDSYGVGFMLSGTLGYRFWRVLSLGVDLDLGFGLGLGHSKGFDLSVYGSLMPSIRVFIPNDKSSLYLGCGIGPVFGGKETVDKKTMNFVSLYNMKMMMGVDIKVSDKMSLGIELGYWFQGNGYVWFDKVGDSCLRGEGKGCVKLRSGKSYRYSFDEWPGEFSLKVSLNRNFIP